MLDERSAWAGSVLLLGSYLINIATSVLLFTSPFGLHSDSLMAVGFHTWLIVVVAIAIWHTTKLIWVVPQLVTGAAMAHAVYFAVVCHAFYPRLNGSPPVCLVSVG